MRLEAAIKGELSKLLEREIKAASKAVPSALKYVTGEFKNEMRTQVENAGLGRRLANTFRSVVYPKGKNTVNAAGRVYSTAGTKKYGQYMHIFESGGVILAGTSKWLVIPDSKKFGGKSSINRGNRNKRLTPEDFKGLRFIPPVGDTPARLVLDVEGRGKRKKIKEKTIFWLFKQVRIGKRINFWREAAKWEAEFPKCIISEWDKITNGQ